MQMLLLSPESIVVYNNKVLWDPLLLLPSFFPFANSKGKKDGFRYNLVNTQCKEQTGASCRPPCLLFVCNMLCVVLGKIFARLTMFQYIVQRRES